MFGGLGTEVDTSAVFTRLVCLNQISPLKMSLGVLLSLQGFLGSGGKGQNLLEQPKMGLIGVCKKRQ